MTGGQTRLELHNTVNDNSSGSSVSAQQLKMLQRNGSLKVLRASDDELAAHEKRLDLVAKKGGSCLWRPEQE